MSLDTLLGPVGTSERPQAVITFDDAHAGAITAGMEEISKRGLPATVFVSPGYLHQATFWWDQLADPQTGIVPSHVRRYALSALEGKHGKLLTWASERGLSLHPMPDHAAPAPIEALVKLMEMPRISLESHTWSHPSLPDLPTAELHSELGTSKAWLRQCLGVESKWIAYPYGHCSLAVAEVTAQHYTAALLVSGGLTEPGPVGDNRFWIPRINIPGGTSLEGFKLRLSGLR